jgi:glycyl-tRNA synthetase beta chain
MSAFLLEIGTEELPASFIGEAQRNLCDGLAEIFRSHSISFSSVKGLNTPRRLAVVVEDISSNQNQTVRKVKGPPLSACFDDGGNPTPAAKGFASKNKMTVEQLEREQHGDIVYVVANVVTEARPVADVLQSEVPKLITRLSGDRMMRWGSSEFKFSRPIRWIVALLDEKVVPISINKVVAGNVSYGHRILHPGAVSIAKPENYIAALTAAFVQVDPELRKTKIEEEVTAVAAALNGRPRQLSGALLEEVVNITEWPVAVSGNFAHEYLDLPDALIETVMVHHQKYFPVEALSSGDAAPVNSRLLPHFITIANNDRSEAAKHITQGNERVLKARLADGRFFFFDDQKVSLTDRRDVVAQLTFQEGLGSYGDKVERMVRTAEKITSLWRLPPSLSVPLIRTLELCKSDLVTNLVRELPELQGHVGSWYAEKEGQPAEVVQAIASHYAPRFTEDSIPHDRVGQLASVIDKVDTLVGLFSIGKKPTGSSDPFAMRRQAQGVVDVLMDGLSDLAIDVTEFLSLTLTQFAASNTRGGGNGRGKKAAVPDEKVLSDASEFVVQRIRNKLAVSSKKEVIDAVLGASDRLSYLPDILVRVTTVESLLRTAQGLDCVRAGIRIGNILKANDGPELKPEVLSEDAEKNLWVAYQTAFAASLDASHSNEPAGQLLSDASCLELVTGLEDLVAPINRFFEDIMVNDSDLNKRTNRHALLHLIHEKFKKLADFSKLQPLIP